MKNKILSAALLLAGIFALMSFAPGNDKCSEWQAAASSGRASDIYIKICEYASGGSGSYNFKNNSNKAVRISFILTFNNGKTNKGSKNIRANSEARPSSCFNCAQKNGGLKEWSLTKIAFEGEEGYW